MLCSRMDISDFRSGVLFASASLVVVGWKHRSTSPTFSWLKVHGYGQKKLSLYEIHTLCD